MITRRTATTGAIVVAAAAAVVVPRMNGSPHDAPSRHADHRVPVTVAAATREDMAVWKEGVGTVQPLEVVDVKPRVDGQVVQVAYVEGQDVAKGALLARVDPRPFQALLAQAVANKARDAAQLANARLSLDRALSLVGRGFVTAQSVDALRAQVSTFEATLAGDQAQIDIARLNLSFADIRAPIAGRTGIRQVNTGASVHAVDAQGVVTLTQMAPIAALFTLPQGDLAAIAARRGASPVAAFSADGGAFLGRGTLSAIDNQIDPSNGRIKLKAVFANADRKLWPGQLVTIRLLGDVEHGAVTVPSAAVQMGQAGPFVYVLGGRSTVARRPIRTGASQDGRTAVTGAIRPGDEVVIAGQSRIADGDAVAPRRARPSA